MQKQKSIKKNMFMSILLTASNFVFPLITYSYVARILTPMGTGKVAFVNSILHYFSYIAILGIPAYGLRECAKVRDNKEQFSKTVRELLMINVISTFVAYAGLITAVLVVAKFSEYRVLFAVMSISIFLNSMGLEWVYQAVEEYSYITIRSLIFKIVSVVLTFVLIHSADDVLTYGFLTIFTVSASNICNFTVIRKYVDFKRKYKYELKKHLRPILSLFAASIIVTIYANFDVSMIGFISTEDEVGLYNAALRIKGVVLSVSTAVTAVIVPRMAYYLKNDDKVLAAFLVEKSLRVSMILSVPLAVYIFFFADKCLLFLCGSDYISAAGTLRILMGCCVMLILTNLFGNQILIPCGHEKRYSQSVFVGMWVNLILNLLLIPIWGAFGAALGTLVTECWNVIWMSGGAAKVYRDFLVRNIQYRVYIVSLLFGALASIGMDTIIAEFGIFGELTFTSVVFFGIFYLMLHIQREPLLTQQLSNIIRRIHKNGSGGKNK